MGVGKSTVGRLLAERLGLGYRDTDEDIVAAEGRTIAEIFVDEGESAFRAIEKRAVHTALAEHEGVLALGGGAILDADTRALLAGHRVLYLSLDVEEAVKRTGLNVARPLLAVNPRKQWRELMEARRHLYEEVATAVVPTDGRIPGEVADKALAVLADLVDRAMDEFIAHGSTNGRNPLVVGCGWSSAPRHGDGE
ncbi:shikimate kinase [Streptomyces sp900105755]|uniref:Shikimate kinase n=1 Tax=Streptomyces sp. 900105755 TaxID=3154389 RepID=A0ABV1TMA5_9ACTN